MNIISTIIIVIIALLHVYIFYMESFAWLTLGRKAFGKGKTKEFFEETKSMAFNQGVYNAFLAAGLIWSLIIQDDLWKGNIALFFLACIAVAGIAGAISADKKIILFQTVPALIGIACMLAKI